MKKLRRFDLKDKGVGVLKALSDVERIAKEAGISGVCVDDDDEWFKDKVFVTDAIWLNANGFYGITFTTKRFAPKFLAAGGMKLLLWFAKHGAYEQ